MKRPTKADKTKPIILAQGDFTPEMIRVAIAKSNRAIDPKLESQIESLWTRIKRVAEVRGKTCYNGQVYRLNDLRTQLERERERERESNLLELEFAPIEFKVVSALSKLAQTFWTEVEYRHRACACGMVAETRDGKYVMVELSGKSMNPYKFDYVGGNIEFPHPLSSGEDLFEHLYRETKEEINLDPSDFEDLTLKAVIQSQRGFVSFHFHSKLKLSGDEVVERFKGVKDPDIAGVRLFDRDEYLKFLERSGRWLDEVVRGLV
jgi:8-oxo-dGTP pyrophosphatase MutT (NUDIX family)